MKRVAAAALVCAQAHAGGNVGNVKVAQLRSVKQQYQKMTRRAKSDAPVPPLPYIVALPAGPEDLVSQHPTLLEWFQIEGCWTPPRVPKRESQIVDVSMKCRLGTHGHATTRESDDASHDADAASFHDANHAATWRLCRS